MSRKVIFSLLAVIFVSASAQKEWWRSATFYQVYPRSFMDTTRNGIGDLQGIISRLDHLKDAGVDTYWLSPPFKSPQKDTGYDVSDYYQIEPDYGTMEDFDQLVRRTKELGLRIMLDFIPNHTSDQHAWFIESSTSRSNNFSDYYVWHNGVPNPGGGQPLLPNNWISVFGGPAWTWEPRRQQYYLHQFLPAQPDLNYRNPEVRQAMSDMLIYYMNKGVSGFRLDAINHMFEDAQFRDEPAWNQSPQSYDDLNHIYTKDLQDTFDFVYNWRKMIDDYRSANGIQEDILVMTEAYASIEDTMRYYRDPTDINKRGAHMPFNFQLIYSLQKNGRAVDLKSGIDFFRDRMPSGETANWVAGSHDHSRVGSRVGAEFIHIANTLVTTLPGASITYYGEEIGMRDNENAPNWDGRNKNRTPMQWSGGYGAGFTQQSPIDTWLPINPNYVNVNLESQVNANFSTYKHYQSLTSLRKRRAISQGSYQAEIINEHVFAYSREYNHDSSSPLVELLAGDENEGFLIVVNLVNRTQYVDLSNFGTFGRSNLVVATAAPDSSYQPGDVVLKRGLWLDRYEALVLDYSSANAIIINVFMVMFSTFAYFMS